MSRNPADLRYTRDHEWVRLDGKDTATVGITWHAQDQLGDVVYLRLPKVGEAVVQGRACGEVESVKAVSEIYAPVSGTVEAVNDALADAPERINQEPFGEGWMFTIRLSAASELDKLLDAAAYDALLAEG